MSGLPSEFENMFGERLPSAAKSAYFGASDGFVDLTRPTGGVVWSKYGAATAALVNVPASRCIEKLETTIGGMGWKVVDIHGNVLGTHEDNTIGDEPLTAMLHRFALRNDGQSIFRPWVRNRETTGEAYIELLRDAAHSVEALEFLNSLACTPVASDGLHIEYFHYSGSGRFVAINPLNMVYDRSRANLFTEINGYSPLMVAIGSSAVGIMQAAGRATMAYFNNDGLPGSVVTPDPSFAATAQGWSAEQQEQMRRNLAKNKSAGSKHATALFPYPIKIEQFDAPDLQKWAELLQSVEPQIYTAFGVPRSIAGDSDSTRYQASPGDIKTWHETLISKAQLIMGVVNTGILPAVYGTTRPPVSFMFDLEPYKHIAPEQLAAIERGYTAGVIDEAEYREALGKPPRAVAVNALPAGDALTPAADAVPADGEPKALDAATGQSLCIALDLANIPDLVSLQSQVKSFIGDSVPVEWSEAAEFHITLAYLPVCTDAMRDALIEAVAAVPVPDLRLTIGSLGKFNGVGKSPILFHIIRNSALLDYQAEIADIVTGLGGELSAYSDPAQYKPHITMGYATGVPPTTKYRASFGLKPRGLVVWYGDDVVHRTGEAVTDAPDATVDTPVAESHKHAHPDALSELEAWRRRAKKHGAKKALGFEVSRLDADLEAHVRYALRSEDVRVFDRISAYLRCELPPVLPDDVVTLVEAYKSGVTAHGRTEDAAHLKAYTLAALAMKSIQANRLDFESTVEDLFSQAIAGTITRPQFTGRMRSLIQTFVYKVFVDGMRDAGVDDLPTEEDDAWIVNWAREQNTYISGVAEAIYKDERVTEDEAAGKPELWFNKSIYPAYYAGFESAGKDILLEWVIDLSQENCESCAALNGQKRRASYWARNIRPKDSRLKCWGGFCGCNLVPTTGAASKGKLPRWQYAKSAGVDLTVYAEAGDRLEVNLGTLRSAVAEIGLTPDELNAEIDGH